MLRLLPRVEAELGNAIEWYEARRIGLGAELLEAAARAFVRIQEAPHQLASEVKRAQAWALSFVRTAVRGSSTCGDVRAAIANREKYGS